MCIYIYTVDVSICTTFGWQGVTMPRRRCGWCRRIQGTLLANFCMAFGCYDWYVNLGCVWLHHWQAIPSSLQCLCSFAVSLPDGCGIASFDLGFGTEANHVCFWVAFVKSGGAALKVLKDLKGMWQGRWTRGTLSSSRSFLECSWSPLERGQATESRKWRDMLPPWEVLVLRARYWHRLPGQYFMDVLEAFLRVNEFSSAPSFERFITRMWKRGVSWFVTEQKISFGDVTVTRNIHDIAFMLDGQIDAKIDAHRDD